MTTAEAMRRYPAPVRRELLDHAQQEITRLTAAIRWALGETDDFPPGKPDQGAYWWRTELRRRAGLNTPTP